MDLYEKKIKTRVETGAKFLDKELPGWWRKVVFNNLEMDNCRTCVLGQVFDARAKKEWQDGYNFGIMALGLNYTERSKKSAIKLGFDIDSMLDPQVEYEMLRDQWMEQIRIRRKESRNK